MYCRNCGRELDDKWKICPYCKTNIRVRGQQRITSERAFTIDSNVEKNCSEIVDKRKIYSSGQEQKTQNNEIPADSFFQIVAERYDYNYIFWKRWKKIMTDISMIGGDITITTHYNGTVSKKKPEVQRFQLQNVLSTKVELRPIWYLMDIILISIAVIWGIVVDITSKGIFLIGITGILLFSYVTLCKALVIQLKDGRKCFIFFTEERDLTDFIRCTGIPLDSKTSEKMQKKKNTRIIKRIIDTVIVLILGMALVAEMMFGIMFAFKGNDSRHKIPNAVVSNGIYEEENIKADRAFDTITRGQPVLEDSTDMAESSMREEFFFWDSDIRKLSDSEIYALSESERQMAVNEIYARHGRMFNDSTVQLYFDCMSWYNGTIAPEDFDDSVFNEVESYNINALLNGENIQAGIDFQGADGIYVSGTYEDSSSLYVEKIDAETISFRIGTDANGISGEATIVDKYTAVYDAYSFFSFTFTWSNSEIVTVYRLGDSTGDSLIDEYTNGTKYWRAGY